MLVKIGSCTCKCSVAFIFRWYSPHTDLGGFVIRNP